MRKKDDTLRDTLLDHARGIADAQGIGSVNIRSIAKRAGVATGTVYNYFSNKDEILLALTERYWTKALLLLDDAVTADSFCDQLEEIFLFLREQIDRSAGKLMSSLGNVGTVGQARMASVQADLEEALIRRMERDALIRGDVWDGTFTRERFARFVMMNLTMLLRTEAFDIHFLIAMVRRAIY